MAELKKGTQFNAYQRISGKPATGNPCTCTAAYIARTLAVDSRKNKRRFDHSIWRFKFIPK